MSWISTAGCMRARLPCEPEAKHELAHLDQRPVTMTGPVLFGKTHFREGFPGCGVDEHRVVTKTLGAAGGRCDFPGKNSISEQVLEIRILLHEYQRHDGSKMRGALARRNLTHFAQELRTVRSVRCTFP